VANLTTRSLCQTNRKLPSGVDLYSADNKQNYAHILQLLASTPQHQISFHLYNAIWISGQLNKTAQELQ